MAALVFQALSFHGWMALWMSPPSVFMTARLGAVDLEKANRCLRYASRFSRALAPRGPAWTPAVELIGSWSPKNRKHHYAAWIETSTPLNEPSVT
jgi:hypothetical protein